MPRRRPYPLLPPAATPSTGLIEGARAFLTRSCLGRALLALLALHALGLLFGAVGLPFPSVISVPVRVLLWCYALLGLWRLLRFVLRRLLWRIRSKLILSYLFIALVPLVLLVTFFVIAGVFALGLMGAHMVSSEIHVKGQALMSVARSALLGLDLDDPKVGIALARHLEPARVLHEDVSFALVRRGKTLAASGSAPLALPDWWKGPGFAGLVQVGEDRPDLLRAVWSEGDTFLVLDLPMDKRLFQDFEKRLGIHLLTSGRRVVVAGENIDIEGRGNDLEGSGNEAPPVKGEGINFVAPTERMVWATGASELETLTFRFNPTELIRRLTPGSLAPGSLNMADLFVTVLTVVGVVFLVFYVVALLLGLLLARSITRSIHALSRGTERIREGDFSHPIPIRSRDQLGELAESFNVMARGIEDLLREQAEKERLEEELRIARQIQMSLLPAQGMVSMTGVRIAALCLPAAEVGGDYYDLLPLSPTRMGVLVADVSGKGTSAALYMAELKGLVLSLSRIYDSPARLLAEANRILAANMDARSFITMTYAVVDSGARRMRFARAGHNPIIQLEAATGRTRVLASQGLGLGLDKGDRFEEILEEVELPLVPGDIFLFFTDGLSEAMNGRSELFGERRLRDLVEQSEGLGSEEMKERILSEVRRFVGEAAQHDDMTLVVLKVVPS
jgi:sigma-B regulation protein RsbU (phosphoserine phosphatase)